MILATKPGEKTQTLETKMERINLNIKKTEAIELAAFLNAMNKHQDLTILKIYKRLNKLLGIEFPELKTNTSTKCQMEACEGDTTKDLFIIDKETGKQLNVCFSCWEHGK